MDCCIHVGLKKDAALVISEAVIAISESKRIKDDVKKDALRTLQNLCHSNGHTISECTFYGDGYIEPKSKRKPK